MQTGRTAGYAKRIERAIALLEKNTELGAPTSLSDLASAAALSPYHFHRIFRLMTGESVGDVVTRVRLGGSIPLLDRAILDAVAQSGYATSQAFARALKDRTGATPSELRNDPVRRKQAEETLAVPHPSSTASPPITIEITSVAPLRLAAIRNIGDYAELNQGFGRLVDHIALQVSPETINGLYGVPHDDPREVQAQACRFDCAISASANIEPNEPIFIIEIDGGSALRLVHFGDYDNIHTAADALYLTAVTEDLQIDGAPLLIHYLHDPEEVPVDELVAHVFLKLDNDG